MSLTDFDKILKEYQIEDFDFGFSAVSEEEYNSIIENSNQTADNYKKRLSEVEKMIIPFLRKLYETGDKEYIYWPNRKEAIQSQIQKILKLTRD